MRTGKQKAATNLARRQQGDLQGGKQNGQASNKKRILNVRLSKLKPHPKQAELFSELPPAEFEALVADMRANGLNYPIEILPDYTVIAGHQRLRAAVELGWETIRCWCRDDLAAEGEAAVEQRLIEDNLHRRQLSQLAIARCYDHLKGLAAKRRDPGGPSQGDVRDVLGKRFNMSGRHLDRLLRLLKLPRAIQDAVDAGLMTCDAAGRLLSLDKNRLHDVAERILNGEPPRAVLAAYLGPRSDQSKRTATAISRLERSLERSLKDFEGRESRFKGQLDENERRTLENGRELIGRLLKRDAENRERNASRVDESAMERSIVRRGRAKSRRA